MAIHSPSPPTTPAPTPAHRRHPVTTALLLILGAISSFLGGFILFADDEQSIGLGGDMSWRVGDIEPAWGYWMLIAGAVMLVGTIALVLRDRRHPTSSTTTHSAWSDVLAHAAIFMVVNGFLWAQDLALGDGLNYVLWVTVPWGVGLVAHAAVTMAAERRAPPPPQ